MTTTTTTKIRNLIESGDYKKAANTFCKLTNTKITISYKDAKINPWGTSDYTSHWTHNRYKVRIDRNHKTMYVTFTDSKSNTDSGKRPTKYDILACLTKYDPYSYKDFCYEYGYNMYDYDTYYDGYDTAIDYYYDKKSYATYKAVKHEYNNVIRLFDDVIEMLIEIN